MTAHRIGASRLPMGPYLEVSISWSGWGSLYLRFEPDGVRLEGRRLFGLHLTTSGRHVAPAG